MSQPPRSATALWQRRARRLLSPGKAWLRLLSLAFWRALHRIYDSNDLTFASSIAYYALLSFFPFLLLALSILGMVATGEDEREAVLLLVLRYFPRQFEFVTTQLDVLSDVRGRLGLAGSLLLVWASFGVFGAITSAVNHAWGVEEQPSFWKHKLTSFVMLVAASVLLLVLLAAVSAVNVIRAYAADGIVPGLQLVEGLRGFALRHGATVLLTFVLGLVFYFTPNARVRVGDIWIGAILTAIIWRGAFFGFAWFVRDMTRLDMIHGSIAAVVVFLFWVYVSAVIFLFGVEFSAAYARLRRHRSEAIPAAPAPRM